MNREKKLLKNTGIIAIGQLSSKLFTFLLLPVYTSLLLPDDYGTIDALQTAISLALYIITLQLECAVFRYLIENRNVPEDQKSYVTSGLIVIFLMLLLMLVIISFVNVFIAIPYNKLFAISIISQSLYLFFSNMARGLGNNVDYAITSFIVTFSSLVTNVVLIVGFNQGGYSILIALIVSNILGAVYYFFKLKIWQYLDFKYYSKNRLKIMLSYSLPLIPNAVSWWIANTSDRIIILLFIGASANGIYAAANKIPTIYTTIFSIFNVAWAESVSLAMKDKDYKMYINKMINKSFKFFSFLNLLILVCVSLFFNFLIGKQYEDSYVHIFILLIAIFVNSLCSLQGGILGGMKNTKAIGWTTTVGAIANLLFNLFLVDFIGLYAASLSTLISYLLIYYFRKEVINKEIRTVLDKRYIMELIVMTIIVSISYFMKNCYVNTVILTSLVIWGISRNKEILHIVFLETLKRVKGA